MRRIDVCINCGEVHEMAAHGLCFKCYRAAERAKGRVEKAPAGPLWASGIGWPLKAQKKAFTVVTNILKAISDCPAIERGDRQQIQNILRPYLDEMAERFAPTEKPKPVNGEQKN